MRLKNKLAVITAAASGMGRAGVELFLKEGAKVAAVDINKEGLDRLAEDMKAAGYEVTTIQADLSKVEEMRSSINEAAEKLGGLDILWAHAGLPGPAGIENLDLALYEKTMAVNVTAVTIGSAEAITHMRKRGSGSIVITSSVGGLVGSPSSPVYSAGKFAVVGLAKSLAPLVAKERIRVNAVCPALVDTGMRMAFGSRKLDPAEAAANEIKTMEATPMGRVCQPIEVAHAALWLASDDASFVTGIALPVDGGYTAR